MSQRATRACVLAVLMLALLLRIGGAAYWHRAASQEGHLFRLGDSHSYWVLASELARGLPYQYGSPDASIFRAPVYPLVLAPCTLIEDEQSAVWAARLLGCFLGTIAVGLVMKLAHRHAGPVAMLFSGLLAAVYPGAIGMSIVILSEAVFCPLMLGYLFLWQVAWQRPSNQQALSVAIGAGCLAGAAILARPSWLLFAPMLFAFGLLFGPNRGRHAILFGGTIVGMILIMSPWWIRNASITGEFVPTTLQVGPSLYDGLHEGATGGSDEGMAFMQKFADEQREEDQASDHLRSTFEFRLNRRAQMAAIAWTTTHPKDAAMLAWRKFLRTWSLWPNGGDIGSGTLRTALTLGCFGILVVACLGCFHRSAMRFEASCWGGLFYWLPAVYFTLLHMIFVGSIRYREPAVLVLTIVAGAGLGWWVKVRAQGSASEDRTAN